MTSQNSNRLAVLMGITSLAALLSLGWAAVCFMHGPNDGFLAHCIMGAITGIAVVLFGAATITSMINRSSS